MSRPDGHRLAIYGLGFFGSTFSTGPPASRQAAKPPPICATGFNPISCAVLAVVLVLVRKTPPAAGGEAGDRDARDANAPVATLTAVD